MTAEPDEGAHDERLVTIEELIAAHSGGVEPSSKSFWLRRGGRHRAPTFRRREGQPVQDSIAGSAIKRLR
jgi:hypothetical protein